jgi:hypothetical protein
MEEIIRCISIAKYDDLFGFETLNPMMNVRQYFTVWS